MDVPANLIEHFVMLTNAERAVASQLLGDNGLDLEAAIASFFAIQEAGGGPTPGGPPNVTVPSSAVEPSAAPIDVDEDEVTPAVVAEGSVRAGTDAARAALAADEALARELAGEAPQDAAALAASAQEDEVRAPIPERVEQILPGVGRGAGRPGAPRPTRAHAVDDPFLRGDGSAHGEHLANLFKPPAALICKEDFDGAMAEGQREKKWLLVNMQRTGVFQCLVLNRDVWADDAVRELVESRFVFWQRDEASEDGKRYKQFYRYSEPPHVAIIDPRSGERLKVWGGDGTEISKESFVNSLVDFCDAESLEDDAPDRTERHAAARTRPAGDPSASGSASRAAIDPEKDIMETEDAQIAAAIAASLQADSAAMENGGGQVGGVDVDVDVDNGVDNVDDDDDDDDDDHNDDTYMTGGEPERRASRLLSATDPSLNRDRSLRAQQDSEYEQSLAMDRAKVESEKAEAERAERAAKAEAARAEASANEIASKRSRIPAPPPDGCEEATIELVVRLPSGKRLQRRFFASSCVGDVYDFVDVEGAEELGGCSYVLMMSYPRVAFSDRGTTLEGAKMPARAALVIDRQ